MIVISPLLHSRSRRSRRSRGLRFLFGKSQEITEVYGGLRLRNRLSPCSESFSGWPTALKNMSSSIGMMKIPTKWEKYKSCSKPPTRQCHGESLDHRPRFFKRDPMTWVKKTHFKERNWEPQCCTRQWNTKWRKHGFERIEFWDISMTLSLW